jgi:MFS family permease
MYRYMQQHRSSTEPGMYVYVDQHSTVTTASLTPSASSSLDTSHLKDRGFMFAYVSSPYIITAWITGPLADAFYYGPEWRWAFAVITVVVNAPLLALFWANYLKAVLGHTPDGTRTKRLCKHRSRRDAAAPLQ